MNHEKHGNYGYEDHGHCRYCGGYNGHHFVEKHGGEETNYTPGKQSGSSPALLILLILAIVIGVLLPPVGVVLLLVIIIMAAMK